MRTPTANSPNGQYPSNAARLVGRSKRIHRGACPARVEYVRCVKVRIGRGVPRSVDLAHFVDESERLKFDSLWVSERVSAALLDPIVAMTFIAARTSRMKLGASVMVLPGRNPALLA